MDTWSACVAGLEGQSGGWEVKKTDGRSVNDRLEAIDNEEREATAPQEGRASEPCDSYPLGTLRVRWREESVGSSCCLFVLSKSVYCTS